MNEFIAPNFPKFDSSRTRDVFPSPAKNGVISMPLSLAVYCSWDGIAATLEVGDSLVIDTRRNKKHLEPGDEMVWKGMLDIKSI